MDENHRKMTRARQGPLLSLVVTTAMSGESWKYKENVLSLSRHWGQNKQNYIALCSQQRDAWRENFFTTLTVRVIQKLSVQFS